MNEFAPKAWPSETPIATVTLGLWLQGRWLVSRYFGSLDDPEFDRFIAEGNLNAEAQAGWIAANNA
jgi:hypothetical protein